MEHKEKVVIVGFGWVGQANALALLELGLDVSYFDPTEPPRHYGKYAARYERLRKLDRVLAVDAPDVWYVVCVGDRVSDDGVQDIGNIARALESLKGAKGGVVLRSTILPEHLETLTFDYYMPEFLHEKKAVEECDHPYFFVLGRTPTARPEPRFFKILRSRSHKSFEGTPREASLIKYLSNIWNALRIAFVNEFGDALGRPTSKEKLDETNRVIGFMFDNRNYLRYGRAFGGHCLPKDSRAFARSFGKGGMLPLLSGMYQSNDRHRQLEADLPLLPEWYSEWPDRHISGWKALSELWYAVRKQLHLV